MGRATLILAWLLLVSSHSRAQFNFTDLPFLASAAARAFTPLDTDPLAWYLAQDYASQTNYAPLTNIVDKTAHGHDATNVLASAILLTNAVLNGQSAFYFPKSANRYAKIVDALFGTNRQGELTVMLRAGESPGTSGNTQPWQLSNVGVSGGMAHPFTDGTLSDNFGAKSSVSSVSIPYSQFASNWHLFNVSVQTNEMILRYNGDIIAGNDLVTSGFTNNALLGAEGVGFYYGYIAEMILHSNVLSAAKREALHQFLANKYGVPASNTLQVFYPTNFDNCVGWWKADDITGFSEGASVTNWPDATSFARHWTNRNTATAPLYHTSTFNGKPSVQLDATVPRKMLLNASTIPLTNHTMIVVGRFTNDNATVLSHNTLGNNQWRVRAGAVNQLLLFNLDSSTSATFPRPLGDLCMQVWGKTLGNFGFFYQNQQISYNGDSITGTFDLGQFGCAIGGAAPTTGEVSEIIVFQVEVTRDVISKLYYTYLKPKYGLP